MSTDAMTPRDQELALAAFYASAFDTGGARARGHFDYAGNPWHAAYQGKCGCSRECEGLENCVFRNRW